jgi:hypothetical protein
MGAKLTGCLKGNAGIDLQTKPTIPKNPLAKTEEEKEFDKLTKAVEVPESQKASLVYFKYTHLRSIDAVISDAQKIVNEVHKLRFDLYNAMEKLIEKTCIYEIGGANTAHAILAIVYHIFTQCKREDAEKLITFGGKFPWFKKGTDSVAENIAKDIKVLFDYFYALEKAADKMPKLVEDCIDLAKKAIDLKDKAVPEIEKADDITKGKATVAIAHNVKMLGRAKKLATAATGMIAKVSKQLKEAYEITKEEHSQLHEYGRQCADEDIKTPLE